MALGRPKLPPITVAPPSPPSLLAVPAERTVGLLSKYSRPKRPELTPTSTPTPKFDITQQLLIPFTRIDTEWVPHLRSAYHSFDDFKTIASYLRLYTSVPEPKFHITFDNDRDDSTLTIYKQDRDSSIRLCIPSNCRTMLQNKTLPKKLREYIIYNAHTLLGHHGAQKNTTTSTNTSVVQIHTKTVLNIVNNAIHTKEPKDQLSYLMVSLNHYQYLADCLHTSPWIPCPYYHGHVLKEDMTRSTTCYGSLFAGTLDSRNSY